MGSRKRIRKKQLKQDKFVQTTFELTDWIRANQRTVTYTALGVLLVVVLGYSYSSYNRSKAESAYTAFYQAMQAYRSGNYALSASDLEKILSEHSGSPIEDQILYYLANAYYKTGDLDKAEKVLTKFEGEFGEESRMSVEAMTTLASVYEQKGEFEKAAHTYIQAASASRFPYQEKTNRMQAARLLIDVGKYEEAIAQYDALIESESAEKFSQAELDEVKMLRAEVNGRVRIGE
ncbi:MAG: tetratricopeptide repeat protein [Candidatus Glassbacteria bacterium]